MQKAHYPYLNSLVHYHFCGTGPELWICLHGYGESGESFQYLAAQKGPGQSILAIDLPFHGQTKWPANLDFTPTRLQEILQGIAVIHFPNVSTWCLAGFSMGGRLALALYELLPRHYRKLLLMAPDGFKVNSWYWLATQTRAGNRLFRFTMKYPAWFAFWLKAGKRLGWVNPSVYRFTRYYIENPEARMQLYDRWTGMRFFTPNLDHIKELVEKHSASIKLFYGRHDRIIRFERGNKFRKGIEPFCSLQILDCGHQVLQQQNSAALAKALLS